MAGVTHQSRYVSDTDYTTLCFVAFGLPEQSIITELNFMKVVRAGHYPTVSPHHRSKINTHVHVYYMTGRYLTSQIIVIQG